MNESSPAPETAPSRAERVAGVFVVFAVLLLLVGFAYYVKHTAERKGWRVPRVPYYTFVQSAEGLKVGDPINMMGFSIGELTVIEAQPPASYYNVYIGLNIRQPYYGYIWTDSVVRVRSSDLWGRRQLEVVKGVTGLPTVREKPGEPTEIWVNKKYVALEKSPKGVYLPARESPSVSDRAEVLLDQLEAALPNFVAVTNRLNEMLDQTGALASNANELVTDVRPGVTSVLARLDSTLATVDTNVAVLAGSLNETLMNLADITSNLNVQVQSNDQMLSGISRLVTNTDDLVQGLKRHWLLRGLFRTNAPPAGTSSK